MDGNASYLSAGYVIVVDRCIDEAAGNLAFKRGDAGSAIGDRVTGDLNIMQLGTPACIELFAQRDAGCAVSIIEVCASAIRYIVADRHKRRIIDIDIDAEVIIDGIVFNKGRQAACHSDAFPAVVIDRIAADGGVFATHLDF